MTNGIQQRCRALRVAMAGRVPPCPAARRELSPCDPVEPCDLARIRLRPFCNNVSGDIKLFLRGRLPSSRNIRYINAIVLQDRSKSLARAGRMSIPRLLLGILCVLLVLLGGTLQAVHSHSGLEASHPDCALCAAAHVVAQTVAAPILPAVAVLLGSVSRLAPLAAARAVSVFALFTRPPPSCSTLA
jgi:hypothetical protein